MIRTNIGRRTLDVHASVRRSQGYLIQVREENGKDTLNFVFNQGVLAEALLLWCIDEADMVFISRI
jgi:hypothetical protein